MTGTTRDRILRASYRCIERDGLAGLTVEGVAREAGIGRATVYRTFPGGHDQLVDETVTWEVGRFFGRLERAIDDAEDLEDRFERAIVGAHRALGEHRLLQRVLRDEADVFLPSLATVLPMVHELLCDEVRRHLPVERLRAGVDRDEAADFVARMFLSYVGTAGQWDLDEAGQVRALVRQLLAGIVEPAS